LILFLISVRHGSGQTSDWVGSGYGWLESSWVGSGRVTADSDRVGSGRVTADSDRVGSGRDTADSDRVGSGRVTADSDRVGSGHEKVTHVEHRIFYYYYFFYILETKTKTKWYTNIRQRNGIWEHLTNPLYILVILYLSVLFIPYNLLSVTWYPWVYYIKDSDKTISKYFFLTRFI
jgi:hypothetical protein